MISYIGGKCRISKFIKQHIPTDIETYVEPFGGMFWVFYKLDLKKYPNLHDVIYNDYNLFNSNLFSCLKHHNELYDYIKNIPAQEEDRFYEYQKSLNTTNYTFDDDNPDLDLAMKYLYVLTQIFSGSKPLSSKWIDVRGKYVSKFDIFKKRLKDPKWTPYFDRITKVENMDFEDFITKYDSKSTYTYCDPPYKFSEKYYSNHDYGTSDHYRLYQTLKKVEGKFSLSYYDFPELHDWYPENEYRWESQEFTKAASARPGSTLNKGVELLIMNY